MCFISSSNRSESVKMSRRQRKVPVSELSSREPSRRSTSLSNMGFTPLVWLGVEGPVFSGPSRLASGRYRMLTVHDRVRRAGGFPGQPEIEANAGKRLVETGLVDFLGVRHALHRRDQIVARSECEIIVEILVAVDVDLRRELATARRRHEEVDVRRTLAMATKLGQQLLRIRAGRAAVARRHDRTEAVAAFGIGLDSPTKIVG